jgi:hypothetical protein
MYANGRDVPQNYFLAAKSYQSAATRGHGGAQFELGILHNKGQGATQDNVLPYMWLNLSAGEERDFKLRIRDGVASNIRWRGWRSPSRWHAIGRRRRAGNRTHRACAGCSAARKMTLLRSDTYR